MKYLGLIETPDDLVTKEYVDEKVKDYVEKIKIDREGYVRFNAANLLFSTMLLAKINNHNISITSGFWEKLYINDSGSLVKMTEKYSISNNFSIWNLIKNERYLYLPNDSMRAFWKFLGDEIQAYW